MIHVSYPRLVSSLDYARDFGTRLRRRVNASTIEKARLPALAEELQIPRLREVFRTTEDLALLGMTSLTKAIGTAESRALPFLLKNKKRGCEAALFLVY